MQKIFVFLCLFVGAATAFAQTPEELIGRVRSYERAKEAADNAQRAKERREREAAAQASDGRSAVTPETARLLENSLGVSLSGAYWQASRIKNGRPVLMIQAGLFCVPNEYNTIFVLAMNCYRMSGQPYKSVYREVKF